MSIKQTLNTRLGLNFSLTQALAVLELPQVELATWILSEIEKNPLLELDSISRALPFKGTREIEAPKSLYEHLMQQIRERFSDEEERREAELILEHLDEKGFVAPSHANSPLLPALQSFDPPGIFARNLKECLLLQLEKGTPAYKMVDLCFEELLLKKFEVIKQKTGIENLNAEILLLARLNFRPADLFRQEHNPTAIGDLIISKVGKVWTVELKDDELPKFHFRSDYLDLPTSSSEEKETLRNWASSGKWVLRSLKRRQSILLKLGSLLVQKQARFLDQKGDLQPLSIESIARKLDLHESTLYRALNGKYALTPRGLLPLRSLFGASSETAKILLQNLIARENKAKPLSDAAIVLQLKAKGEQVARRTVAKYRAELNIAPAARRKVMVDEIKT